MSEIMNTAYPVYGINHDTNELMLFPADYPGLAAMVARKERIDSPSTPPAASGLWPDQTRSLGKQT